MSKLQQASIADLEAVKRDLTGIDSHSRGTEYKCQICQDNGVVVRGDQAWRCECVALRRRERLFKSSRITPAFQAKTLENFETKGKPKVVADMFSSAMRYSKLYQHLGSRNWLTFLGEPGSGKTHLIIAVANKILEQGTQVLYFPHVDGIEDMKKAMRAGELSPMVDELKRVPVLLWDDLLKGREAPTDWVLERTFEVLNYRYLELLPTLISSERTPEELMKIDKAIGSRIAERSKGNMVVVEGWSCNHRLT